MGNGAGSRKRGRGGEGEGERERERERDSKLSFFFWFGLVWFGLPPHSETKRTGRESKVCGFTGRKMGESGGAKVGAGRKEREKREKRLFFLVSRNYSIYYRESGKAGRASLDRDSFSPPPLLSLVG